MQVIATAIVQEHAVAGATQRVITIVIMLARAPVKVRVKALPSIKKRRGQVCFLSPLYPKHLNRNRILIKRKTLLLKVQGCL